MTTNETPKITCNVCKETKRGWHTEDCTSSEAYELGFYSERSINSRRVSASWGAIVKANKG